MSEHTHRKETCEYKERYSFKQLESNVANFQVLSIMVKDTIKTKSWKDKAKVVFTTYWRPEDCIEEKPQTL